jgi:hypothetical protein
LVDAVIEAPVANVSGEDGPLLARSDGEWRRVGVILARLGTGVSTGSIPELARIRAPSTSPIPGRER